MIPSRGLRLPPGAARQVLLGSRQYSSISYRTLPRSQLHFKNGLLISERIKPSTRLFPLAPSAPRFLSTQPANSPPATPSTSEHAPELEEIFKELPNATDPMLSINPHIGYMTENGIDFGYGITSMLTWLLEHIHVYAGTPWWGTAIIASLIVRSLMLYPMIRSSDTMARLQAAKPVMMAILKEAEARKVSGDTIGYQQAITEYKKTNKAFGIKYPSLVLSIFAQTAIGFCSFRLLRALATQSFPGLETGGFAWVLDLSIPDPFFIFPLALGGIMHMSIRTADNAAMTRVMRPILFYGMPLLVVSVTCFQPALVQLSFFVAMVFGLGQSLLLRNPRVRNALNIVPLPKPSPPGGSGSSSPAVMSPLLSSRASNLSTTPSSSSGPVSVNTGLGSKSRVEELKETKQPSWFEEARQSMRDVKKRAERQMMDQVARGAEGDRRGKEFIERAREYERRRRNEKSSR